MDNKKIFWPVFAILVGVLALMVNLGYLPAGTVRYWPVLLVIWGLMKIADPGEPGKKPKK